MSLPKPKPWATEMKTYWSINVPTAVGGTIPGWSAMVNQVVDGYNAGKVITYIDEIDGQLYQLRTVTATELRFFGRIAPNYPNSSTCTQYIVLVNRSNGAITRKHLRMTQTGYITV